MAAQIVLGRRRSPPMPPDDHAMRGRRLAVWSADLGGRHGRARCGDPVPTTCRDPAAQRDQCHPHAARGQDARWAATVHVSKVVQQEHRSLQGVGR